MEGKNASKIEVVDDPRSRVPVPRGDPRLSNVAGLTTGVKVVLECADFDSAVDAIERVQRAWNNQLDTPSYSTEQRAFVVKVERLTQ